MRILQTSPSPVQRQLLLLCAFFLTIGVSAQHTVNGTVLSAEEEEALIGVNILVKGTDSGTITDIDGSYQVEAPSPSDTLVVSYVGYKTLEVPINGRSTIDINLSLQLEVLEEVVVVGYGVQRKSDLTGSVSTLKPEEVTRIPNANVEQSLQGKIPGVQVTPVSGEPGAGAAIRIRGVGTFNNASPLYVVDGMLLDNIDFLNPNDIESINVLKDASATAIYGSRGANGVIIITTKKGTAQGRTAFNFDSYYGWQEPVTTIDLVNASQYAQLANEVSVNQGGDIVYDNPDAFTESTDWQDVIFRTAPQQSYQLSANGAYENISFNLSANYFQQDGIIRGSDFDRITLRLNAEYQLRENVTFGHNVTFVNSNRNIAPGVLTSAYRAAPIFAPRDSAGNFTDTNPVGNPEASLFYLDNNVGQTNRTVGNLYAEIDILPELQFRSSFGLDLENSESRNFAPVFFVSPLQQNEESNLFRGFNKRRNWLWENTLTYTQDWGIHALTGLAGVTAQENRFEFLNGSRRNIPEDQEELFYLNAGDVETQANSNGAAEWSMFSYLFRVNYSLLDRYLFTASFRADGSSRFGPENRFGYFPSFAVGWRIMDEPWMENQRVFSRLKLRAGWGVIGNDKISEYPGRPVVTPNLNAVFGRNQTLQTGASIVELANPEVRWESTEQYNLGLELGFLDDRLLAEIDLYQRVTDGILLQIEIPDYVGVDAPPFVNAADILNSGVDFKLDWRERVNDKFSYNLSFIGSTVYNETLELGQGKEALDGGGLGYNGILGTRTVVGQQVGSFFGYKVEGIFQNEADLEQFPTRGGEVPGDLRYADINGDGVITGADRTFIGDAIPDFTYGFTLGANYAGFDLTVEFNGQTGVSIWNAKKAARFGIYNFEVSYLDRWMEPGSSTTEPRVTNGGHNYLPSERFIENGNFMRLRNIVLGYTLPAELTQRANISNLRFFVSGTNLVTWTDYSGYTPEIAGQNGGQDVLSAGIDQGVYPIPKTVTLGLNVGF